VTNIIFIFETSPNTKTKEKKVGGMAYYMHPFEKVGGTRPLVPQKIAPITAGDCSNIEVLTAPLPVQKGAG